MQFYILVCENPFEQVYSGLDEECNDMAKLLSNNNPGRRYTVYKCVASATYCKSNQFPVRPLANI